MKHHRNNRSWSGIVAVYLMVIAGVITGTYYGTRLPLGKFTQYDAPTQVR